MTLRFGNTLRKLRYTVFFVCFALGTFAQSPDSLLHALKTTKDTNRIHVLFGLYKYYTNKDNSLSLNYALEALTIAKKQNYPKFEAMANTHIGNAYNGIGDYTKAAKYLLAAYAVCEKNNLSRLAARAANALGNMYIGQKNNAKAEQYYRLVLNYANKLNDAYIEGLGNVGISNVYKNANRIEEAIVYIDKAIAGFKKSSTGFEYLICEMNKASMLHENKEYERAYTAYKISLPDALKTGDKYLISSIYLNIGNTCNALNKPTEALINLREALRLNHELNAVDNRKDIYKSLSETYRKMGEPDSAFAYLYRYIHIKDSLFNVESSKQINEAEAKYNTAKKDAQIKAQKTQLELKDAEDARKAMLRNFLLAGLIIAIGFLAYAYRSNILKKRAYTKVSQQKLIIEHKNKEIVDSIEYARRIQKTLLASDGLLKKHLNDFFILYKPKDIVSGDFYWATEINDLHGNQNFMLCTADCTGHGVPGAFMSLLCISFLNEITRDRKYIEPNQVFTRLKKEIVTSLNPEEAIHTRDGMDAVLCHFDFKNLTLHSACANNPILIVRNNELIEIKPDKNPIGKNELTGYDYTLHNIPLQKGDLVYTFTDGYSDQFGGVNNERGSGKKFKYKRLKELIFQHRFLSMNDQKDKLNATLENWMGNLEQLDDILVIGIRV